MRKAPPWSQVVSGLVKHIPLEELEGRSVVIVANLKAANMRGIKSQAMVLAASSPDGNKVIVSKSMSCSHLHFDLEAFLM